MDDDVGSVTANIRTIQTTSHGVWNETVKKPITIQEHNNDSVVPFQLKGT